MERREEDLRKRKGLIEEDSLYQMILECLMQ